MNRMQRSVGNIGLNNSRDPPSSTDSSTVSIGEMILSVAKSANPR